MKQLSQRQHNYLNALGQDLFDSIQHYKETLEDGDEIDYLVSMILNVIDELPMQEQPQIVADDRLWRFTPHGNAGNLEVRRGTIVKVVRTVHSEMAHGDIGPMALVRFVKTDCHEALVYLDELEEV